MRREVSCGHDPASPLCLSGQTEVGVWLLSGANFYFLGAVVASDICMCPGEPSKPLECSYLAWKFPQLKGFTRAKMVFKPLCSKVSLTLEPVCVRFGTPWAEAASRTDRSRSIPIALMAAAKPRAGSGIL